MTAKTAALAALEAAIHAVAKISHEEFYIDKETGEELPRVAFPMRDAYDSMSDFLVVLDDAYRDYRDREV